MFRRLIGRKRPKTPMPTGEDYFNSKEYVRNQKIFDEFNAQRRAAALARAADPNPEPFDPVQAEQWRQRGDVMGNEGFPNHLHDEEGNVVYTRRGFDGWYDNDGIRRFDLAMRPVDSPNAQ